METVLELKNKFETKLSVLKSQVRVNDPIYNFLAKDLIGDFVFDSHLRMLPYELVEKYGIRVLEDKFEYDKYKDPKYDIFRIEWDKHHLAYWNDKLQLLEDYMNSSASNESPLEIFNRLSNLMIKIERRSLLLRPEPKIVEQNQTRLSGAKKDYKFLRAYWVDETGEKKRMIAKHIGERYQRLEKEVSDLFYNRGYAVHRNYRLDKKHTCDMVVEMDGQKTAVEIKMVNEDTFNNLFLFDEMCKRFEEDYKNTP
jgi:hypothetical protein